jgi:hypothetical protein
VSEETRQQGNEAQRQREKGKKAPCQLLVNQSTR